jgi:hypothetical protein
MVPREGRRPPPVPASLAARTGRRDCRASSFSGHSGSGRRCRPPCPSRLPTGTSSRGRGTASFPHPCAAPLRRGPAAGPPPARSRAVRGPGPARGAEGESGPWRSRRLSPASLSRIAGGACYGTRYCWASRPRVQAVSRPRGGTGPTADPFVTGRGRRTPAAGRSAGGTGPGRPRPRSNRPCPRRPGRGAVCWRRCASSCRGGGSFTTTFRGAEGGFAVDVAAAVERCHNAHSFCPDHRQHLGSRPGCWPFHSHFVPVTISCRHRGRRLRPRGQPSATQRSSTRRLSSRRRPMRVTAPSGSSSPAASRLSVRVETPSSWRRRGCSVAADAWCGLLSRRGRIAATRRSHCTVQKKCPAAADFFLNARRKGRRRGVGTGSPCACSPRPC